MTNHKNKVAKAIIFAAALALLGAVHPAAAFVVTLLVPFFAAFWAKDTPWVAAFVYPAVLWVFAAMLRLLHVAVLGYIGFSLLMAFHFFFKRKRVPPFNTQLKVNLMVLLEGLALFLPLAVLRFGTDIVSGAAEAMVRAISRLSSCDEWLIFFNRVGLAGMTPALAKAQNAAGAALLPAVRQELLASFTTSLKLLLSHAIPAGLILYSGVGAVGMVMIPVVRARKYGIPLRIPEPFERWRLTEGMARMAVFMAAGYVIPLVTANPAVLMAAVMMRTLFKVMLVTQGLAAWSFWQKKSGWPRAKRRAVMTIVTVLFYQVPLIMGVAEQMTDRRGLRPKKEEDAR